MKKDIYKTSSSKCRWQFLYQDTNYGFTVKLVWTTGRYSQKLYRVTISWSAIRQPSFILTDPVSEQIYAKMFCKILTISMWHLQPFFLPTKSIKTLFKTTAIILFNHWGTKQYDLDQLDYCWDLITQKYSKKSKINSVTFSAYCILLKSSNTNRFVAYISLSASIWKSYSLWTGLEPQCISEKFFEEYLMIIFYVFVGLLLQLTVLFIALYHFNHWFLLNTLLWPAAS